MEEKMFSFEEVSKHNTEGDCWVVIHGNFIFFSLSFYIWENQIYNLMALVAIHIYQVYDVSRFLDEHPGGDEVMLNASSGTFSQNKLSGWMQLLNLRTFSHTDYARGLMKDFLIGKIDANTLPKMQKKYTKNDASSSNDSSSHLLLYDACSMTRPYSYSHLHFF
ncbi:hypothetical protein SASPL_124664 [Salvia splendens]|uniref:Cytochrome b5 heme-binding domain-containing protein n=1 Tax=Salvia splendens TaxID=180675 RepID=A0A8X8ZNJ4_SALSN|nr:hypothetical protein SASPL_124664 [Salvia splendens]